MTLRRAWLLTACLLYLLLAGYQLGLPGLHYDEAREAGVNALEILTGAPITAFRGAGIEVGDRTFPLMVQDYIGALNVYLALPLLGLSGIGVPSLRVLPLLTGLAALLALERALAAWVAYRRGGFQCNAATAPITPPITVAGLAAVTILAASPSFVFWARQGVFVTNLMLPLTFAAVWQAVRWLHTGRTRHLLWAAFAAGLALYAKLLALWAIAPLAVLVGGWWLWQRRPHPNPPQGGEGTDPAPPPSGGRLGGGGVAAPHPSPPLIGEGTDPAPPPSGGRLGGGGVAAPHPNLIGGGTDPAPPPSGGRLGGSGVAAPHPSLIGEGTDPAPPPSGGRLGGGAVLAALALFLLALTPLILFNLQTGGTLAALGGNAQQSYYGVDNADLAANLPVRWNQVWQVLRGEQFWYLGAVLVNPLAPWLALLLLAAGLVRDWRLLLAPLLLTIGVFAASLFTISDLFVTHYVLMQPLLVAVAALGAGAWLEHPPVRTGMTPPRSSSSMTPVLTGLLAIWLVTDLGATLGYHRALAQSGGLADHSDASYHLAYHLQYNGMGAPIALDWGMDAPVRYLSRGTVTPIEIFGYASPDAPDTEFVARLAPFLENPDNTYLLHAPPATVFQGRREAFFAAIAAAGRTPTLEQKFSQRNGAPLYEIWRVR